MSNKISESLCQQWYTIKFCVMLEKMVTETKEMFDAA